MALSWLSSWTASARAAYGGIIRGVREGLSARAIGSSLRAGGMSFSNDFLFSAVREVRKLSNAGSLVAALGDNQRPDPAKLPFALTETRRRYSFLVEVEGTNSQTGAVTRQHVTVSTDRLLTRGEMEAAAIDAVESAPDRYGLEDVEATALFGMRASPGGLV